ncbi:hypothetical protein [Micromonospora sp. NPDC050276]|uniref:hypothetical protein n=1 Tax=Micromonospora sp. NPDC050276 TaxID=3364278 RepID=UPI00379128C4
MILPKVRNSRLSTAGGHAVGAARDLRGAARHAAHAAGQAGTVADPAAVQTMVDERDCGDVTRC